MARYPLIFLIRPSFYAIFNCDLMNLSLTKHQKGSIVVTVVATNNEVRVKKNGNAYSNHEKI